jgi:hypothetical protein
MTVPRTHISRFDEERVQSRRKEPCRRVPPFTPWPNHFNQDRHLNRRDIFKQNRSAAGRVV